MLILPRFYQGDVSADFLEAFVHNYMLMEDVEQDLQAGGHTAEYDALLKLQADGGVQIDIDQQLKNQALKLEGTPDDAPQYGIDPDAPAPGEHTQRLYEAYEPVTYARLQALLPAIQAKLSGEAVRAAFQYASAELGVVFRAPLSLVGGTSGIIHPSPLISHQ